MTGPVLFLAAWQTASSLEIVDSLVFPSPTAVGAVFFRWKSLSLLAQAVYYSALTAATGFALAVTVGGAAGVALGWFARAYDACEVLIEFVRSLPAAALLPPLIAILGIGKPSHIALVAVGAGAVMIVSGAAGVRRRNSTRSAAAVLQGASTLQVLTRVALPDSLPTLVTGARVGASLALVLTVVCEMLISTTEGLGRRIVEAQQLLRYDEMYAAVLLAGALGYAVNHTMLMVSHRFVHWEAS